MGQHTVKVWDKPHTVTTNQKSKSVWVCGGEYMGEYHTTEDRSESTAIKRWREWATYKGN